MFEVEYLPLCIAIGIDYNSFWDMNPHIVNIFKEAYKQKRKMIDEEEWIQGAYFLRALEVALDRCFNGKSSKSKYFEKPFLQTAEDNAVPITEEQKKQKTEQLFNMLQIMQVNFDNSKD